MQMIILISETTYFCESFVVDLDFRLIDEEFPLV